MANIVRWQPFSELMRLRQAMDSLFDERLAKPSSLFGAFVSDTAHPIDMYQTDNDVVVKATLPGLKPEDVDVERLSVQLGLDRSIFSNCMSSEEVMSRIQVDLRAARQKKIGGTPTYFIDAQSYPGAIPEKAVQNAVTNARNGQQQQARKAD